MNAAMTDDDDFSLDPTSRLTRDLCLDAATLAQNDPKTRRGALHFAELAAANLRTARGLADVLPETCGTDASAHLADALEIVLSLVSRHLDVVIHGLIEATDRAAPVPHCPGAA